MELKLIKSLRFSTFLLSLNRTFMELKLLTREALDERHGVLIEPLWNWNSYPTPTAHLPQGLNRTFMELKLHKHTKINNIIKVLIEPLWNWNKTTYDEGHNPYNVLIEPLWNWNNDDLKLIDRVQSSLNRTFMELKRLIPFVCLNHYLS